MVSGPGMADFLRCGERWARRASRWRVARGRVPAEVLRGRGVGRGVVLERDLECGRRGVAVVGW